MVTVQRLTGGEWGQEAECATLRAGKACARDGIDGDGAARRLVSAGVVVFTVGVVGMVGQCARCGARVPAGELCGCGFGWMEGA